MARQKKPFDAVQFTRESAERVARVVRQAEISAPAASPLTFDKRFADRIPKQVRAATFSGSWPIGSVKTVTFKYTPTATANVVNLSWPIALTGYVNENCLVGKEGTNWWLVVPVLQTATAVFATQTATAIFVTGTATSTFYKSSSTQSIASGISLSKSTLSYISDVSVTATLNTTNCQITVGTTKTNGSIEVVTGATVTTSTISVVSNTTAGSYITSTELGSFAKQTATASFLTLRVP
jgi:hypothetical protein